MPGGTMSGPSASTARKHRQPPAAISTKPDSPLTCRRPVNVARIPAPANTTAAATRSQRAPAPAGCSCWPPSAATGATRVADLAGITAAATVTTSPEAIEMATADGCSTTGPGRHRGAEPGEQPLQPPAEAEPGQDAGGRGDQADDRRFQQGAPEHLAAAGPDAAQQGQFPAALGDQDVERVVDDDAGDHERDEREHQDGRGELLGELHRRVGLRRWRAGCRSAPGSADIPGSVLIVAASAACEVPAVARATTWS